MSSTAKHSTQFVTGVIRTSIAEQIGAQVRLNHIMYTSPLIYVPDDDCYLALRRALDDAANSYHLRRVAVTYDAARVTQYRDGSDRLLAVLHTPAGEE